MIYTGSYKVFNNTNYNLYSISKDKGEDAGYVGKTYLSLAPLESFFRVWKNNRGIIDTLENNKYYINEFYEQILSKLDPKTIYEELDNSILLCYEDSNDFCHRHLVSAWFELFLGVRVDEVNIIDNELVVVSKPTYIKEYLEYIIRKKLDIDDSISISSYYNKELLCLKPKIVN